MIEIGHRRRSQPAPPRFVFEALIDPDRDPARPWLKLRPDEMQPQVIRSVFASTVVWSSLWPGRPDARIEFALPLDRAGQGTDLEWRLYVEEPAPDEPLTGHLRKRINELINRDLRYSFGQ